MKFLNKCLISVAAISMVACSSMDVDSAEALEENFPADFDHATYMQLYPQLVSLQVRDYVSSHNASVKGSLTSEQITADNDAFLADTAQLHKIYANPNLGGFTETLWEGIWSSTEDKKTKCASKFTVLNLQKIVVDSTGAADTVAVKLFDPITVTPEGAGVADSITAVSGVVDTTKGDVESFTMGDSLWVMSGKNMGTTAVDSSKCVTTIDTIPSAGIPTLTSNFLKNFNFVDTKDDWKMLSSIAIDTMAISFQYVMYGRDNGWAYRKCKAEEASNPAITETYPVTKLYCVDDAGVVREIK